jgi:hypothetical protein
MTATIGALKGKLLLQLEGDKDPVELGDVEIPLTCELTTYRAPTELFGGK